MFSSIFKEVSSYFDKRAFVSAFAPSLVLWTLLVIVTVFTIGGWNATISWWKGSPSTKLPAAEQTKESSGSSRVAETVSQEKVASPLEQILLLFAFFVCVGFTSFLILNFHPSLLRLYAGSGPKLPFISWLLERNRERWRSEKERLDERFDRLLNADTNTLKKLQHDLQATLQQPPAPSPPVQRSKALVEKIFNSLETVKRQLEKQKKKDGKQAIEKALEQLRTITHLFQTLEHLDQYKNFEQAALGKLSDEGTFTQIEAVSNSLEDSEKRTVDGVVTHLKGIDQLLKDQNDFNAYSNLVPSIVVRLTNTVIATLEDVEPSLKGNKGIDNAVENLRSLEQYLTPQPSGTSAKVQPPSMETGKSLDWFICKEGFYLLIWSNIRLVSIERLEKICKVFIEHKKELNKFPSVATASNQQNGRFHNLRILIGGGIRGLWSRFSKSQPKSEKSWDLRYQRLNKLAQLLQNQIKFKLNALNNQSAELDQQRFFYLPSRPSDIMPTRLGNVLRAAEVYTRDRYNLSANVIWTWLEAVLPKEAGAPLYDAKTSLDLMITCSFLSLVIGIPLASWSILQRGASWSWWVLLIPGVLIILLRSGIWGYLLGMVLIILGLAQAVGFLSALAEWNALLTLSGGIFLLSWVCYLSSVHAAASYGERYRVAFDMYRWKILEALHLQLPPDFEEERRIWGVIGQTLFRGSIPEEDYWQYVQLENTKKRTTLAQTMIPLPVPLKDLPSGQEITEEIVRETIMNKSFPKDDVWMAMVANKDDLIGKTPRQTLLSHKPIPLSYIDDEQSTVAVGIPVTSAMIFGGSLQGGSTVDLILIPAATKQDIPAEPILFANLKVLEVKSIPVIFKDENKLPEPSHVVVVAIPIERRFELAIKSPGATFLLTKGHD